MIVEELINKLQQYPPHYTVQAALIDHTGECDDETADFVATSNYPNEKIVNIELAGRLS